MSDNRLHHRHSTNNNNSNNSNNSSSNNGKHTHISSNTTSTSAGPMGGLVFRPLDRRLLKISSFFLLLPALYAMLLHQHYHGLASALAAFASIWYWKHPNSKARNTLDLTASRLLFLFYLSTGIYCASTLTQVEVLFAYPLTPLMVGCYLYSTYLHSKHNKRWVYSHFFFHVFGTLAQINTLNAIDKCYRDWDGNLF